ncbi:hypothetical protein MRX96_003767 [Rhipicephalus microplus]
MSCGTVRDARLLHETEEASVVRDAFQCRSRAPPDSAKRGSRACSFTLCQHPNATRKAERGAGRATPAAATPQRARLVDDSAALAAAFPRRAPLSFLAILLFVFS